MSDADVIIVGAGLAGLAAALTVQAKGRTALVLEAGDGVGGRVRTDLVDGFLLDRGFQILLPAYPEARRLLDLEALDLRAFHAGAEVWFDGAFHVAGDPMRHPGDLWPTLRAPIGSLADKVRILRMRRRVRRPDVDDLFLGPDTTAEAYLVEQGFSSIMIERFLRPLFAGITLDRTLAGSSRQVEFVFRMLSEGGAAVPSGGMGRIAGQMAARIGTDAIRLDSRVQRIDGGRVTTVDGRTVTASEVILATDPEEAGTLAGTGHVGWNGVTSIWLAAPEPPTSSRAILLDGEGRGPAVDVTVMSNVNPSSAPAGRSLVVASAPSTAPDLTDATLSQMRGWFGPVVDRWEVIRVDRIPHAQPKLGPGYDAAAEPRVRPGLTVAGDHRRDPSINGALHSGRRAAEVATDTLGQI